MDHVKGGSILIEAASKATSILNRPLHLTFAGDGPERRSWEHTARRISAKHPNVTVDFPGWVTIEKRENLLTRVDLLVIPSLWPEPFGMVGIEAGLRRTPAAAFAVGGIPEWLTDGVNGHLAPGDPPTASGLAEAIVRCFEDPDHYRALSSGALEIGRRFTLDRHLDALLDVFAEATGK
jgi:glycosyltransferase involved in cell wall biosynthesis